jgi:hypothetical protein
VGLTVDVKCLMRERVPEEWFSIHKLMGFEKNFHGFELDSMDRMIGEVLK